MTKRFKSIFICLTIFLFSMYSLSAMPNHTQEFYINDFANILSEDVKNYVFLSSKTLDEQTTAQVVVATVQSLEEKDIEAFANELFRNWNIGSKDKNNGLLILVAPNERNMRIEVGYGLEGTINDAKAGRFYDLYATPYFKEDNWDEGIKQLYSALISEIYKEYDIQVPENVSESYTDKSKDTEGKWLVSLFGTIIISILISMIFKRPRRWIFGTIGSILSNMDDFDGFNGGGFSGGGFSGGGFSGGGFSGGGGSSGGGGASRSF